MFEFLIFNKSCFIIPINIKINDGQKVRNAIIPNITGFGFGSSNIPSLAHNIINNNGEHPTIKIMSPILVSLFIFFIREIYNFSFD